MWRRVGDRSLTALAFLQSQLARGEEVATCPSCSLLVRVVYDMVGLFFSQSRSRALKASDTDSNCNRWITKTTRMHDQPFGRLKKQPSELVMDLAAPPETPPETLLSKRHRQEALISAVGPDLHSCDSSGPRSPPESDHSPSKLGLRTQARRMVWPSRSRFRIEHPHWTGAMSAGRRQC